MATLLEYDLGFVKVCQEKRQLNSEVLTCERTAEERGYQV